MLGEWSDLMVLKVSSNQNDSTILTVMLHFQICEKMFGSLLIVQPGLRHLLQPTLPPAPLSIYLPTQQCADLHPQAVGAEADTDLMP